MKKFTFGLAPVLEQRERVEEQKQHVFAQCQLELQRAQDELARLNSEYKRHATTLREDHRQLTSDELRWHYAHLDFLDRAMTAQQHVISQHAAACEQARRELVEASRDRKVIEKLKARKFEQHVAFEQMIEQRESDDANARRYSRRGLS
ncbi:MAG: flagellar export protein FliJ [Vulcanimicrobiaceae bacterium]